MDIQLYGARRWFTRLQAAAHLVAPQGYGRLRACGRSSCRSDRIHLGRYKYGHSNLRFSWKAESHHSHSEWPRRELLFRRTKLRYALRDLRRQGLQAEGQIHRRSILASADQAKTAQNIVPQFLNTRRSVEGDSSRIIEIYNEAIRTGYSTAETEPTTVEQKRDWFDSHDCDAFPILVIETENEVVGWSSLSPYRPGRQALRYTAEISYYVSKNHWRKGIGTRLVSDILAYAKSNGYQTLFGILLDSNEPSIRLLERFGFEHWGHLPNVAEIKGLKLGHVYMGKRINDS